MSLMFAAIRTRPDIIKEITFLATRVSKPTLTDSNKLLKIIGYLKKFKESHINFKKSNNNSIELYSDASHNIHENTSGHTGIIGKLFYFYLEILFFGSPLNKESLQNRVQKQNS